MDPAKAARLCADHGGPYAVWATGGRPTRRRCSRSSLFPTTAGSGSEASGGMVIADEKTHMKTGIASPHVRAQYALVDPALTYAAAAHADAWRRHRRPRPGHRCDRCHSPHAGRQRHRPRGDPPGRPSRCRAVSPTARTGRPASEMACASLMAGIAMNISDCGSEHSLAMALGGRYGSRTA